jgi:hypothetical protein
MAVNMSMSVFWIVTLCGHVGSLGTNVLEEHTVSIFSLKFEAVCSETLVSARKSAWHHNSEDQHRNLSQGSRPSD